MCDEGDGLQNVWNLWWVRRALLEGRSPWHTDLLCPPEGVSLWAHTLNPFNGLLATALAPWLSPVATHNAIVAFSFVAGGVTGFLLGRELTGSRGAGLFAGFAFTFSSYHFAHAAGHLQLVSLEWIPLFLLAWWRWLREPTTPRALGAAGALLLVLLCDYYYFGFSLLAAAVLLGWRCLRARRGEALAPGFLRSLALFGAAVASTCGPIVGSLAANAARDPLAGAHDPREFSLDLLAPVVPGGNWRLGGLTQAVWSRLPGGVHETSVHFGVALLLLLGWAIARRRALSLPGQGAWWTIAILALAIALGPDLRVGGNLLVRGALPYAGLEAIFPALRLGGTPVRWIVLAQLCASLIGAAALLDLWRRARRWRVAGAALVPLLALEVLPRPLPRTSPEFPGYVRVLRTLPADGAVLDLHAGPGRALYHQTGHGRPLAFGYLSRLPSSVVERTRGIAQALERGDLGSLCRRFGIRYLVVDARARERIAAVADLLYADGEAAIGRLRCP